MSFLDDQLEGKFKNIPFYVRKESLLNVGQTRVNHRYPKSAVQYQEAMGEEPFSESIELFFWGDDYVQDFKAFERAIRDPLPGRLFSPTFGIFDSIVAQPATFESDQTQLGQISATVVFEETVSKPSPTSTEISEEDVSEQAQASRDNLLVSFASTYISPSTLSNLQTALSDITGLIQNVQKITNKVREATTFLKKVNALISDPTGYANALLASVDPLGYLQSLSLAYNDLTETIEVSSDLLVQSTTREADSLVPSNSGVDAGFNVFTQMSGLGSNFSNSVNDIKDGITPAKSALAPVNATDYQFDSTIPVWDETTAERIERNTNRVATVEIFRFTGLIGMYENASRKTYNTTDEIESDLDKLNTYYEDLVENNDSPLTELMKPFLEELKNQTEQVLQDKSQQAFTVTTIDVLRSTSSYLLAYELYGEYLQNDDQHQFMSDLIAGLNRSQVRSRLKGEVKVVEIGS